LAKRVDFPSEKWPNPKPYKNSKFQITNNNKITNSKH
jgi:hypothetical protein